MKTRDLVFFTLWVSVPLVIILSFFMSGCSPIEVKLAEELAEEIIVEDLEHSKK